MRWVIAVASCCVLFACGGGSTAMSDSGTAGAAAVTGHGGSASTPDAGHEQDASVGHDAGARHDAGGAPPLDAGLCASAQGTYDSVFTARSGDCGAVSQPAAIQLGAADGTAHVTVASFTNNTVTTETNQRGCALTLSLRVENMTGTVVMRIDAQATIDPASGAISGSAEVQRFGDDGAAQCSGSYDLVLGKLRGPVGGNSPIDRQTLFAIMEDCAKTVSCAESRGEPLPDDPVPTCVEDSQAVLAAGGEAKVTQFLAKYGACKQLAACEYVSCAQGAH